MCSLFGVSPSGFYAWRKRPESQRKRTDRELGEQIEQIHAETKQRYGAVRMHRALRNRGHRCSKKRVERLRRQRGLRAARTRRWVPRTTDSRHRLPVAANVLAGEFTASQPNQKWAGDITYVPTSDGWLYLAVIIDLFSRRIVGWAMSDRIDQQLTRSAMLMALGKRLPVKSLMVHSDRGVQYAARDYQRLLADWSVTPSMSRRGNCYDNAVSESFFATLKKELVHRQRYRTRHEARQSIFEYIEVFYNRVRLHSTLDYRTPIEVEQEYFSMNSCPL
jgi:transposase InsO family protein